MRKLANQSLEVAYHLPDDGAYRHVWRNPENKTIEQGTHQLGLSLSAIALGIWRSSRLIAWRLAYQPVVTNVVMEMELISFQSEQNNSGCFAGSIGNSCCTILLWRCTFCHAHRLCDLVVVVLLMPVVEVVWAWWGVLRLGFYRTGGDYSTCPRLTHTVAGRALSSSATHLPYLLLFYVFLMSRMTPSTLPQMYQATKGYQPPFLPITSNKHQWQWYQMINQNPLRCPFDKTTRIVTRRSCLNEWMSVFPSDRTNIFLFSIVDAVPT